MWVRRNSLSAVKYPHNELSFRSIWLLSAQASDEPAMMWAMWWPYGRMGVLCVQIWPPQFFTVRCLCRRRQRGTSCLLSQRMIRSSRITKTWAELLAAGYWGQISLVWNNFYVLKDLKNFLCKVSFSIRQYRAQFYQILRFRRKSFDSIKFSD